MVRDSAVGPQPDGAPRLRNAPIMHRAEALRHRCDAAMAAAAETMETSWRRLEESRSLINSTGATLERARSYANRSAEPS
jgi:hypothetical protein